MRERFTEIERAVESGTYTIGSWQRLLADLSSRPRSEQVGYEDEISRVSRQLHRRHGFAELPFTLGFLAEGGLLIMAALLLSIHHVITAFVGAACLA